ncbi:hypothetical protein [Pandoraea anhela]|uniref:Glycerophosphoryl diester phosphodiesterase membrane domain-containing protein n=1 Tax=Pandoraea anhela TaxID=2508295 RepID=A0A5E4RRT3_9BURK|nr:hypothetical protein [Pandoraea anhela]VVD65743.1 hypothetical protein PAN31108_00347 [Pandoraea anhela]
MEPITFTQCFKGAWIDGLNALRNRPLLCLSITVVLLITSALGVSFRQLALTASQSSSPALFRFQISLLSLAVSFVNLCALAILAVHVLRYVVLGPDAARHASWLDRGVRRYVATSFQVAIVWWIALIIAIPAGVFGMRLVGQGSSRAFAATLLALLVCVTLFLLVRISLIFPQIAAGRSKRWRSAWLDSRGHFWSMFGTSIATLIPLIIGGLIAFAIVQVILKLMPQVTVAVLASLILQAVISVIYLAVACAVLGWLYHRYADQLLVFEDAPDGL